MKAYVLSIAGAVLLSAIVTLIAPKGKLSGVIKATTKLVCLFVLLAPFVSFAQSGEFSPVASLEIKEDKDFLNSCKEYAESYESERLEREILQSFGLNSRVETTCGEQSPYSVKKLLVKLQKSDIIGEGEHIDIMRKIEEAIEKRYGCEKVVVWED